MVEKEADETRNAVLELTKQPDPFTYTLLVKAMGRLGIEKRLKPPAKANIDGVLELVNKGATDTSHGEELFFSKVTGTNCVACHRIAGRGNSLAPELSGIGSRVDAKTLAQSILDPSAAITEGYQLQTFAMDDGTMFSGAVLNESGNEIRLVTQDGTVETIATKSVEDRAKQTVSAMPSGFDLLGNQQVADLVAFLLSQRIAKK